MNQILKNHSALQSELFSHFCELTYRTGTWNNLFQYLLLNMFWPRSIKAFRSLSCTEITEQRRGGEKKCVIPGYYKALSHIALFSGQVSGSGFAGALAGWWREASAQAVLKSSSWRSFMLGTAWCMLCQGSKGDRRELAPKVTARYHGTESAQYRTRLFGLRGEWTEMYSFLTI